MGVWLNAIFACCIFLDTQKGSFRKREAGGPWQPRRGALGQPSRAQKDRQAAEPSSPARHPRGGSWAGALARVRGDRGQFEQPGRSVEKDECGWTLISLSSEISSFPKAQGLQGTDGPTQPPVSAARPSKAACRVPRGPVARVTQRRGLGRAVESGGGAPPMEPVPRGH